LTVQGNYIGPDLDEEELPVQPMAAPPQEEEEESDLIMEVDGFFFLVKLFRISSKSDCST
jgi:hypothetical protein